MFGNAQAHRAVRVTMDDSAVNGMRKGVGLRPTTVLGMGLAIAILIAMPVAFADGTRTTYSGRAFGASVHVGPLDAKFADTGDLPAEGGEIDATTVTVHTDPAQAEVLLSVTMGFDEKAESEAATAAITVNALHLTLVTGDEVIVSSAHSDITCGQGAPTPKDFVTGGGFIETPDGKANFGFVAGFKPGQPSLSGALNYLDHAAGIHVKASTVTGYRGEDRARTFSGDATVNGESGFTYTVTAADIAEPGRGADSFEIWVSNGYHAYGKLAGGNIQLHG